MNYIYNMRLTKKQLEAVKEAFYQYFLPEDSIWLFGSRADDRKKGGDIDLYIETNYNLETISDKKSKFWTRLIRELGDQKIDVTINELVKNKELTIYKEARNTGIKLNMTKKDFLKEYIKISDLHIKRLNNALQSLEPYLPLTAEKITHFNEEYIGCMDRAIFRFTKLQDVIGKKVFPLILEILGEEDKSFIDKLHKLEKLEYLPDSNWWDELRETRNRLTHDYPDDYANASESFNDLVRESKKLTKYWDELKVKMEKL